MTAPSYVTCPNCGERWDTSGRYTSPANNELDRRSWADDHLSGKCLEIIKVTPVTRVTLPTTSEPVLTEIPLRFAQHLVSDVLWVSSTEKAFWCELARSEGGRCRRNAVAVRWESNFADMVCQEHADSAIARGTTVVFAKKHDGSDQTTL